jgi:tetratricopeptide (TPR) repeat protein
MEATTSSRDDSATGGTRFAPLLLVLAALAAYANSFSGAFLYDDHGSIVDNPTIRTLWPPGVPLSPPRTDGLTVSGRPVLNLTFAVNYTLGQLHPWGYHAVNLAIHAGAALLLYGLVRRLLAATPAQCHVLSDIRLSGQAAGSVAFVAAILWLLHPLQTEAVTYIVQRAESLMGFFYLLTLYAFVRGARAARPVGWWALSAGACLLGMGTKEVMVSAPLVVLLLDRACFAGRFAAAWRLRRGLYLALAATWVPLGLLVLSLGGNRGGSIGVGLGLDWWGHWLTQFRTIGHYLRLTFWPHPLVFDYGAERVAGVGEIWFQLLLVGGMLGGTAWALRRRRLEGVLGVWFFAVLAPTSLIPGPIQVTVEHRMYLALAPLLLAVVLVLRRIVGPRLVLVGLVAALPCGTLVWARNRDYRSEAVMWGDTAAKRPENAQARYNHGASLFEAGRIEEAIAEYEASIRLRAGVKDQPDHNNLAVALAKLGRYREALPHYEAALRGPKPNPEVTYNYGLVLYQMGDDTAALARFEEATRLKPDYASAWNMQGLALISMNRLPEAVARFEEGLRRAGPFADLYSNLGLTLMKLNRAAEGVTSLESAVRLLPEFPPFQNNLGIALAKAGRLPEAAARFRAVIRLQPSEPDPWLKLASVLLQSGRADEALATYEELVRVIPTSPEGHEAFAQLLSRTPGREIDAARQFSEAQRLREKR